MSLSSSFSDSFTSSLSSASVAFTGFVDFVELLKVRASASVLDSMSAMHLD